MIICYHTTIDKPWSSSELEQKIAPIPSALKQKILKKRNHSDVQLSVGGNLLVLELLKHFNLDLTLNDLLYNPYHRPYFNAGFDFNISHAGNRVICCATTQGKVGIDIELTAPVNFDYDDYFTTIEQQNIRSNKDPNTEFFKYWTRKEALLKAIGTGVYTPLLAMDVSGDIFTYKGETYYLSPIDIDPAYQSCMAHTVKQEIAIQYLTL
ncbi:4'-phosphopantetheinyl transferase superfamily protein [Mucilaginibacter sp.]|uniref:4'-phosphopantetheinyl transferase family protein n=1 Tax=Mucilaginibacter sp. TaxID=1882438 RepID=UPI00261D9CBB|nr:4'-phosphopantetheinyl transferase superfamily protein [Mucilaginibacter sp.]MDB4924604.1 4-phosphopantetheinyl transferase superfamily protein [Mucilaginibacter sp.]